MTEFRTLELQQLLRWAEDNRDIMRLHTDRDLLPGGYMAAFSPALVAWQESNLHAREGHVLLRNVNYGGNPLERTTVLHTARVPLAGLQAAEMMLVPLGRRGRPGPAYHVELRFIFKPDCCPEFLDLADSATGTDARFPDLILSWEAWRSPDQKFSLKEGLDEAAYALSMRAFAGPQLFLEDSFRDREWISYRLCLPGEGAGLQELLKVSLALGDGVARNTIRRVLRQGDEDWTGQAPANAVHAEHDDAIWDELCARIDNTAADELDIDELGDSEQSYHALVRSCATLTRHAVLVTAWRLIEQGHSEGVDQSRLPGAELARVEGWMKAVAHADLRHVFLSAPSALKFLIRNPQVLPARIPDELEAAGLIEKSGGKAREVRYGRNAVRPYAADGGLKRID